jgi:hypothetical protein
MKAVVEVESQPQEKNAQPGAQLLDITDLKNQSFRYVY